MPPLYLLFKIAELDELSLAEALGEWGAAFELRSEKDIPEVLDTVRDLVEEALAAGRAEPGHWR